MTPATAMYIFIWNFLTPKGNLALFLNAVGKSKVALTYMKRSLYLTCLMGGISHPDVATTYVSSSNSLVLTVMTDQHRYDAPRHPET